ARVEQADEVSVGIGELSKCSDVRDVTDGNRRARAERNGLVERCLKVIGADIDRRMGPLGFRDAAVDTTAPMRVDRRVFELGGRLHVPPEELAVELRDKLRIRSVDLEMNH